MILVTGGTGLIGSHLLFELARCGEKVKAIRRKSSDLDIVKKTFSYYSGNHENLFIKIDWTEGDMLDPDLLGNALNGVDRVYHCAAVVSFEAGMNQVMTETNVIGTANLVNACLEHKIKKLCYVSSTAAVGQRGGNDPSDESVIWRHSTKQSAYSVSKFKSEMEVWRGIAEGVNAVIVNPSIVIGPGNWDRSSGRIFRTVWEGLDYYTHGVTGYVDVRDVVQIMVQLMESDISKERFILSAENLSYGEVFEMVSESLHKRPPRFYAHPLLTDLAWRADWLSNKLGFGERKFTRETARSGHNIAYFSNAKIRNRLGIGFIPIRQSIEETGKYFLKEFQNLE